MTTHRFTRRDVSIGALAGGLLAALQIGASAQEREQTASVETQVGRVRGKRVEGISSFLGYRMERIRIPDVSNLHFLHRRGLACETALPTARPRRKVLLVDILQIFRQTIHLILRYGRSVCGTHFHYLSAPLVFFERGLSQDHSCRVADQALAGRDIRAVARWERLIARW